MTSDTKTQREAWRHHYVPEFYLHRFASDDGRLAVRHRHGRSYTHAVKKVLYGKHLYKVPNQPLTAEGTLGDFEAEAGCAFIYMDERKQVPIPGSKERDALALFMGLQLFRTESSFGMTSFIEQAATTLDERPSHADAETYMAEQYGFVPPREEVSALCSMVEGYHGFPPATDTEEAQAKIDLMFRMGHETAKLLHARHWSLETSKQHRLITSDRPVVQWHPESSDDLSGGTGIPEMEEIWLIIDPLRMLVLRRQPPERNRRIGPERVEFVNQHIARHCTVEIVTGACRASDLQDIELARRRPLARFWKTSVTFEGDGESGAAIQSWSPIRDVPDYPKDPMQGEKRSFRYAGPRPV